MDNVIGALWFLEGSPGLWDDLMTERKGQVSRSGAPDGLGLSGYRAGWDGCIGQLGDDSPGAYMVDTLFFGSYHQGCRCCPTLFHCLYETFRLCCHDHV